LPGTSTGKDQNAVTALPANTQYDNPILSSNLVRKALFEGFNRATAANNDLGISNAVGAPAGTARMADSIYNSNLAGAYAPTTFPGLTGAQLGQPDVASANADLNAAGWDGTPVTENGMSVRTWGNHPTFDQQARLGLVPGTKLKLDISHFSGSPSPIVATDFVSDMKAIGVEVFDRNNLVNGATNPNGWQVAEQNRNFEIGIVSYCNGDDPVIGVQRQYLSTIIPLAYAANTSGYRDQGTSPGDSSMDGLWYQANRTTTAAQRTAVYAQIQSLAVSTNTEIPIDESVTFRVTRSVCQGLNNQNTGLFVETAYCSG
jgi:peptide/nickel transport system substrate-binding protein